MNKFPLVIVLLISLGSSANEITQLPPPNVKTVFPVAETTPITSRGDAADDTAIWVDFNDPASSLIVGTDKEKGIEVYSLDGKNVQSVEVGRVNNVDYLKRKVHGVR